MTLKNKLVERVEQEKETLKKQFSKLIKELQDKSDSESADDLDMKVKIVEQKQTIATLESRMKNIGSDLKVRIKELETTCDSLQAQNDYSVRANGSLREDYDLL
jgi:hypothetical protein